MKRRNLTNSVPHNEGAEPTAEELRDVEKDVAAAYDRSALWQRKIANHPVLSDKETIRLIRRAKRKRPDIAARNRIVQCNMGLVFITIYRFFRNRTRHLAFDDMVQEGVFGLMRAVEKFKLSRSIKFSTYAVWWIRGKISRAILDREREVRLPVDIVQKLSQLRKSPGAFSEERAQELRAVGGMRIVSLDAPVSEHSDGSVVTFGDLIPAPPNGDMDSGIYLRRVIPKLASLPQRLRLLALLRLGGMTFRRLGRQFGLSRERARQLEVQILEQIDPGSGEELSFEDAVKLLKADEEKLPRNARGTLARLFGRLGKPKRRIRNGRGSSVKRNGKLTPVLEQRLRPIRLAAEVSGGVVWNPAGLLVKRLRITANLAHQTVHKLIKRGFLQRADRNAVRFPPGKRFLARASKTP